MAKPGSSLLPKGNWMFTGRAAARDSTQQLGETAVCGKERAKQRCCQGITGCSGGGEGVWVTGGVVLAALVQLGSHPPGITIQTNITCIRHL